MGYNKPEESQAIRKFQGCTGKGSHASGSEEDGHKKNFGGAGRDGQAQDFCSKHGYFKLKDDD